MTAMTRERRATPSPLSIPLLVLVPLLASCGGDAAGGSSTFSVRDSAGVQVAESTAPAWGEDEGWRVSAEPTLQIGEAEGAPQYLLSRVGSATRRSDGSIVLANSGSQEIRTYGPDGAYLRSFGREGGGPGEFQRLGGIYLLPGDSILAYDFPARRLSLFSPEGEFVRASTLQGELTPNQGFPQVIHALSDGSVIVRLIGFDGNASAADGLTFQTQTFLRFSATGELLDTVSVQPPLETYQVSQEAPSGMIAMVMMTPSFGREQVTAVTESRIMLGSNKVFQVEVYAPEGALERIIRVERPPRPVTDEMLEALARERSEREAAAHRDDPLLRRAHQEMPHAATVPFYSRALGDDAGNLWLREYDVPEEPEPAWMIFDPEGRLLGTVALPADFTPSHIGEDFVLGVWRDELDVERVRMYGLEKG
jgi:hypothetical protein